MSITSDFSTTIQDEADVLSIAVMGPTGTGKSSFINLLSGSNLGVGRELESCTDEVQISESFSLDGHTINLIDTPGFDDTKLTDTRILNMIASYLALTYSRGKRLAGVIYMHRITDNRIGGISARNFRLFRSLCGETSLCNVVIVTTMWDNIDISIGEERERELMTKESFFKPAIEKGCRMLRHNNTLESAQAIVRSIAKSNRSVTLQIQEELGRGLDITETRAGKELCREVFEQMERHREEIRGIVVEIQEAARARDEESRKELTLERARTEAVIARLQEDSANVTRGYHDALSKLEERLKVAEASAAAHCSRNFMAPGSGEEKNFGHRNDHAGQTHSPIVQAVAATENSNAVLEGKLAAAIPIVGFWGRLAVMLAPFSLTWR
ncbi:hypothetical protein JR316_0005627 [Psilocybe cubensis]|uniref:G domain-containing protein n=2 Tax=Psilocybe cubensis TaxID=181762 RepID=A0A8H7XXP5_PSICU|nr:hypothetical protein JR316_0005627 [Psilocybe cubensis]KAH9481107.1 hypothetical protein JR316_0005627 [Psilocybe cubensis]